MKSQNPSRDQGEQNEKEDRAKHAKQNEVLRIVMVGKTGIGKSASGNTILGRKEFDSKLSAKSMTTDCSKGRGDVDGQEVAVIDTPGLFDTRLGRFTEEEKKAVETIQEIFGKAADKYSMVLFTGGDSLEDTTIKEFVEESPDLKELVDRCNGQYHVFNNKLKDRAQVTELLQKIRDIVQKNGGSHYTNNMFQEAEKAVEEEKQRILKENEEQRRREKEKLERELQEKHDKEMAEIEAKHKDEKNKEKKKIEDEKKRMQEEHDKELKKKMKEKDEEDSRKARVAAENSNPAKKGWGCSIL